jgi:hypothetical protein
MGRHGTEIFSDFTARREAAGFYLTHDLAMIIRAQLMANLASSSSSARTKTNV